MFSKKNLSIYKTTLFLGFPLVLQELINASVNLLDVLMIGKLGDKQVTAVGNGNEVLFLFSLLVFGAISGSAAFIGQFWGKKDIDNIHKTIGLTGTLSFIAALIFFIPSQLFPEKIISFYIKDAEVIEFGVSYLKVVSYTFFINAFIMCINAALKSIGQTRLPFASSLVALVTNFIFNYLFIFVLKLGVAGAAFATIISRAFELCFQIILVKKFRIPIFTNFKNYFTYNYKFFKEFIKVVWPVAANEVLWSSGVTLCRKAYGLLGTESAAAIYITGPVQQIFSVFGMSLGFATGILIANSLGAGEIDEAIEYSRKSSALAVFLSIIMSILLLLFSNKIVNFYSVSELTKINAKKIIYIMAAILSIRTFNFTAIVGILRNGGDNIFCLLVDTASVWLVSVPLAFLGASVFHFPVYFVFGLASLDEITKLIFCFLRVKSNKWVNVLTEKV